MFPHGTIPRSMVTAQLRRLYGLHWALGVMLLCALTLYSATLDNGLKPGELEGGDLITHQYAQVQARPSNAPGYPLFTMGGWLWFHTIRGVCRWFGEPYPNPTPILSSYSTLWALLALWLFWLIVHQISRSAHFPNGDWLLTTLLSFFYAVTYFFWYYATTTEQYSSAIAQTLAIVYVYLRWRDQAPGNQLAATPLLLLLVFLCGLSLAHMLTVVFIVPPLAWVVLWQAPGLLRRPGLVLAMMGVALLPLGSYSYVYVRGINHPEWWGVGDWQTPQQWFWAFLTVAQGREELGWALEPGRPFWGVGFPILIWQELSLPLLVLGLLGIAWLERRLATLLYSTLLIYAIFCWAYRYGNWYQVILPAYPLILLGIAPLAMVAKHALQNSRLAYSRWLPYLVYAPLLVAIFWRLQASLPAANSRNHPDDTALAHPALLLAQPLPANANVYAAVGDALGMQYLSDIWDIRPDVQVVSSIDAGKLLANGEPVFSTWQAAPTLLTELPADLRFRLQSAGPDWVVLASGADTTIEVPVQVINQPLTPGIILYGYTVKPPPQPLPALAEEPFGVDVTLLWRLPTGSWPDGVSISLRPLLHNALIPAPAGGYLQEDRGRPIHNLLPLQPISTDETIVDAYRLPLLTPLPAGADGIQLLIYRQTSTGFENLAELALVIADK